MDSIHNDEIKMIAQSYQQIIDKIWLDRDKFEEAEEQAAIAFNNNQSSNLHKNEIKASQNFPQSAVVSSTKSQMKLSEQIALARKSIKSVIENVEESKGFGDSNYQILLSLQNEIQNLSISVQTLTNDMQGFEKRVEKLESSSAGVIKSNHIDNDGSWTNISSSLDSLEGYLLA